MSGEEFYQLFNTHGHLRKALCQIVFRFSRCFEQREDMLQEAWIAIAEKEYGQTDEYYSAVGYRAIEACYRRDYRYRKALEKYVARHEFDATYRRKRYFLKVAKKQPQSVN